jgi:hypothetical protein
MYAILMEWSLVISGQMSSWVMVCWSLWRLLFDPEVMVLSGQVSAMSQLARLLRKQLIGQLLGY